MPNPNNSAAVVDLLRDRQNIGLAWEIWKTFPVVIERLQIKFWRTLESLVRPKVSDLAGWQLPPLSKRDVDLLQQWFNILLLPRAIKDSQLSCQFALEQRRQSKPFLTYEIYFGIRWSDETPRPMKSPQYEALCANLEKNDFSKSSWWIGYKYLDFKVGDDPQILEQLASADTIEEEVASEFANFVAHYEKGAERLNKILATAGPRG